MHACTLFFILSLHFFVLLPFVGNIGIHYHTQQMNVLTLDLRILIEVFGRIKKESPKKMFFMRDTFPAHFWSLLHLILLVCCCIYP